MLAVQLALAWVWLLLTGAATGLIVQDIDPLMVYDDTWFQDNNTYALGGTEHKTTMNGGTASYAFTGESKWHLTTLKFVLATWSLMLTNIPPPFPRYRGIFLWRTAQ